MTIVSFYPNRYYFSPYDLVLPRRLRPSWWRFQRRPLFFKVVNLKCNKMTPTVWRRIYFLFPAGHLSVPGGCAVVWNVCCEPTIGNCRINTTDRGVRFYAARFHFDNWIHATLSCRRPSLLDSTSNCSSNGLILEVPWAHSCLQLWGISRFTRFPFS